MSAANPPATGSDISPPGKTRLITDQTERSSSTLNRETDARTALTRGLAEYLTQQSSVAVGGREVRFKAVFGTWASPEDRALYPAAAVYSTAPGMYDAHSFTPTVQKSNTIEGMPGKPAVQLVKLSEFDARLTLEIWAADPKMRQEICALVESSLNPVDWMFGMRLELPHYFNERGEYQMLDMAYQDDPDSALRGFWKAMCTVRAHVNVVRVSRFPLALPKARVDDVGPYVVVRPQ